MPSFSDFVSQMNVCKVMACALPRFHDKTGISLQFNFVHNPTSKEMEVSVGFSNGIEPSETIYNILLEEILNAEKLLTNEYIMNNCSKYENLNQLLFKHQEDTLQIIKKQKYD